jgi:serine protease Do
MVKKSPKTKKVQKPIIVLAKEDWTQLEADASGAVVQVCAQVVPFNWLEPYATSEEYEQSASGFFIDEQGGLLTNAHVVAEAKVVWIKIPAFGKRSFFVDVVGICPDRDIALLRLRPEELEFLKMQPGRAYLLLGNSDLARPTDKILVLGYPLGQNSLKSSIGIISGRENGWGRTFLQVTAPVNPGNSGGPLFNEEGHVIGVVVATISSAQNINFVIPSNDIAVVLDQLYEKKFVRCGVLGVRFNNADDVQARYFSNPVPAGFYINLVIKGSLLEKAGIEQGDMLYYFNDLRIDGEGLADAPWSVNKVSVQDLISRLAIGQKVTLVVYRNGKKIEKSCKFELTKPYAIRKMYPAYETIEYEILGGMVIMQLALDHLEFFIDQQPNLLKYAQVENMTEPAVIITHLIPGSVAHQQGSIHTGQIIKEVNGKKVTTFALMRKAIADTAKPEFLTIKTTDNAFVVFDLERMKADDQRLAKEFSYPKNTVLLKNVKRKTKKAKK